MSHLQIFEGGPSLGAQSTSQQTGSVSDFAAVPELGEFTL